MSPTSRVFVALLLLSLVTIQFGGHFLLTILRGKQPQFDRSSLTFSLFRAGHAHAGVLVILAIVVQPYIDAARGLAGSSLAMVMRVCFFAAPLLVSGGMFGAGGKLRPDGSPGPLVALIYAGVVTLAAGLVLLGVELLRL